ncbi:MAG TPA: prenyltransferase/squalene oxidase repeat-containing protein [Anaerolineales bacterium]|nr:prenyltransferase/squalene oxidase repeat-containing protein [Anaerolineales bacterium]
MKRLSSLVFSFALSILIVLGIVLFLRMQAVLAQVAPSQTQVIDGGLAYLKSQQQPGGGITGFSGGADPDTTARSVLAYVVAGENISEVVSAEGNSMMDYLASQAISFTHDTTGTLFPGRTGELLSAVILGSGDPKTFGGMDLISELEASYHSDTGAYSTQAKQDFTSGVASDLNQAWAILGLSLAGETLPELAAQYLNQSQAADGSWGAGDPDTTALAMTALLASQNEKTQRQVIQRAIDYFHTTQADSGGWKPSWDTDPLNADSTGWIIQALVSAGEDLRGQSWTKNNINPVDALLALQKPDNSIGGTYANTYSTAEAIIGLAGVPLTTYAKEPALQLAGLAIFSGGDSLITECISFTGSISGLDLLQRSGMAIETATNPNQGTAVCKIGDVGDASNNCFGSMPNYWAYWILGDNGWQYSAQGAVQSEVVDGGVYAWAWGQGKAPAILTFQGICSGGARLQQAATVTPLPATETSIPSPVATRVATLAATQVPVQPTTSPVASGTHTSTYIIYALVLLVLGLLIIILIRSRGR